MATYLQRGQAIGNALINGTATPAQLNRLGRALAYREARLTEYDAGTNDDKAAIFVLSFRAFCIEALQNFEGLEAADDARQAAAGAVDTAFVEAGA